MKLFGFVFFVGLYGVIFGQEIRPVANFGIPDSNVVSLERSIPAVGNIGTFIPEQPLFVAKGTLFNQKGKLFNLINESPHVSSFFIANEETGKRTKVKVELDTKHNLLLTKLYANHEGSAVIGTDDKGSVIVWLKKIAPPDEKKIDHIYKIKSNTKLLSKPIQTLRLSPDDDYIGIITKDAKEVYVWLQSFKEKPALYRHNTRVYGMDFDPSIPGNFVFSDSVGRIFFVAPKYPAAYTKELFLTDSIDLPKQKKPIERLYYTPSAQHIIAITKDRDLYMFDAAKRRLYTYIPKIHDSTITGLTFLKEANYFLTSSLDKTVKLWSTELGNLLYTLKQNIPITDVSTSSTDNYFIAFDKKDSANQYYFNDYMLNSLFIFYNMERDIHSYFKQWLKDREVGKIDNFVKISNKAYLQNKLNKLIEYDINRYATMAFYKNFVTLKTDGYDDSKGLLSCKVEGFESPFKLKIEPKDTNFFKVNFQENIELTEVNAKIADDGGIVLNKGKITVKEKPFLIVPNRDAEPLVEPFKFAFTVDSSLGIYFSYLNKLKVDSFKIREDFIKSDVDTVKLFKQAKLIAGKNKAVFLGIGFHKYKDKMLSNPFGQTDVKSVHNYLTKFFSINKTRVLQYVNISNVKLKNLFTATSKTKGDFFNFVKKNAANEIYIYIAGASVYVPKLDKDFLISADVALKNAAVQGISWENILVHLGNLPAAKINVIIESDIKNKAVFYNANPKINILMSEGYEGKEGYDKIKFHSLLTYAFLKTLFERKAADINKNRSLTFSEIVAYMKPMVAKRSQELFGTTQKILFFGKDKGRVFLTYKAEK